MKTQRTIRVWHRDRGETTPHTDYQRLSEAKRNSSSAYELRDALARLKRPVRSTLKLSNGGM